MLSPIPRKVAGGNLSSLSSRPCGNASKSDVHYIASNGSLNQLVWKVVHPSLKGNCTVRLGNTADDTNFRVLTPLDKVSSQDGSFPCGRESTRLETVEVRFPNMACDSCTLQWEWSTEKGKIYLCGDIQIDSKESEVCAGKCLNNGVCYNGNCQCKTGFSGDTCQYAEVNESKFLY